MRNYFDGNEYHTADDRKIYLREKLIPGNTKGFYSDYLRRVNHMVRVIKKGEFTYDKYADVSKSIFDDIEGHGGKFDIQGLDNLRNSHKSMVVVANHMSVMETQLLTCILCPRVAAYVIKDKLLVTPMFKHIMRSVPSIPIARTNPIEDMKKVMEKGKELLDQGISVIIFPEGTRKDYFAASEFNSLGVKLAVHAKVPVIPLALKTNFWGQGRKLKDFGRINRSYPIKFHFSEPIIPEGRGKNAQKETLDYIEGKLRSWDIPVR